MLQTSLHTSQQSVGLPLTNSRHRHCQPRRSLALSLVPALPKPLRGQGILEANLNPGLVDLEKNFLGQEIFK